MKIKAVMIKNQTNLDSCAAKTSATVTHLKKFIAKKLLTSVDKHKDVEIYCNDELLFKDHTLKFVYVTKWRTKEAPIVLKYCATPGTEVEG